MSGLLSHPVLRGADLAPLRHAVVKALERGCGARRVSAFFHDAWRRVQTAGLGVAVARGVQPAECPSDEQIAERAAIEDAWRAGRAQLSERDPGELGQDAVMSVADQHAADQRRRQAFLAGWRGQPLSSALEPDRGVTPTAVARMEQASDDATSPPAGATAERARTEIRQLFGRSRRADGAQDRTLGETSA